MVKEKAKRSIAVLIAVSFSLSFTSLSFSADKYWAAKEKEIWSSEKNWSPAGIPTQEDDVLFDTTSSEDCTIDISVEVNSITLDNALYTGTVTQEKIVKVKKGFYLKGSKDNLGGWTPKDNIIESAGDWINDIGLEFGYLRSIVRLTGSGKLAGFLFNQLEAASSGHATELISWSAISGTKGEVILGGGILTGKGTLTFYKGSLIFKEKPPVISIIGINFRGVETIPGANYNCKLYVSGTTEDNYLTLTGDIACESLSVGNETKEKTTTLDTAGNNITITKSHLIVGVGEDKYGALKCKSSTIKVNGNVTIGNEGSSIFGEDSTWDIEGKLINKGSLIKGNAEFMIGIE